MVLALGFSAYVAFNLCGVYSNTIIFTSLTFCLNTACVNLNRFTSEFDNIERLGEGAFGYVFKARNKLLEKHYAIKIVRCKE